MARTTKTPNTSTHTKIAKAKKSSTPRRGLEAGSDEAGLQFYRAATLRQGYAALDMLENCIAVCPIKHWEEIIGNWPFWQVAHHTLCFADLYTAVSNKAWKPDARFHPTGRKEFTEPRPSRRFEREELIEYAQVCRERFAAALEAETPETLAGPSGFSWMRVPRYELYPYNSRHVQHHVGQLSAALRRCGCRPKWVDQGKP